MKKLFVLTALAAASLPSAHAVDIKAGDWTVSIGGIVNAYYTTVSCSGAAVGGLALGGQALGCGGDGDRTTVGNGLLPNGLVTSASTTQGGYDVKALIGIYNSTATDSAIGQNSVVDVRQAFFTFGNASMGTVKLGRDYGIFGAETPHLVGAGDAVDQFILGQPFQHAVQRHRVERLVRQAVLDFVVGQRIVLSEQKIEDGHALARNAGAGGSDQRFCLVCGGCLHLVWV